MDIAVQILDFIGKNVFQIIILVIVGERLFKWAKAKIKPQ
jgi:hypothetical protein